jgi:glucosamine--fructose-6-phosphate aminotransferase (isomerizing)
MIFLEDGEMAVVRKGYRISTLWESRQRPQRDPVGPGDRGKGGYKHFMLKEIYEQPRAIVDTVRGRVSLEEGRVFLEGSGLNPKVLKDIRRVCLVACGTSYHAAWWESS